MLSKMASDSQVRNTRAPTLQPLTKIASLVAMKTKDMKMALIRIRPSITFSDQREVKMLALASSITEGQVTAKKPT